MRWSGRKRSVSCGRSSSFTRVQGQQRSVSRRGRGLCPSMVTRGEAGMSWMLVAIWMMLRCSIRIVFSSTNVDVLCPRGLFNIFYHRQVTLLYENCGTVILELKWRDCLMQQDLHPRIDKPIDSVHCSCPNIRIDGLMYHDSNK